MAETKMGAAEWLRMKAQDADAEVAAYQEEAVKRNTEGGIPSHDWIMRRINAEARRVGYRLAAEALDAREGK